jgi:hypothetical protein
VQVGAVADSPGCFVNPGLSGRVKLSCRAAPPRLAGFAQLVHFRGLRGVREGVVTRCAPSSGSLVVRADDRKRDPDRARAAARVVGCVDERGVVARREVTEPQLEGLPARVCVEMDS